MEVTPFGGCGSIRRRQSVSHLRKWNDTDSEQVLVSLLNPCSEHYNERFLMRILLIGVATTAVAVLAGCSQGTPGGPGVVDENAESPTFGQADDTFNLSVPILSTSLQQGGQMTATFGIKRAKNFDQNVSLRFGDIPKGVSISTEVPEIKSSDTETTVTFNAANEAPLGDFKIKVTGHPTEGSKATVDFKITITAKDSFKLGVPRLSTPLMQGESTKLTISISREKQFDEDVELAFGELPMGVTLTPMDPVIKKGDSKAEITISASSEASLGNFSIKVTGHPSMGVDASSEILLTVVME